MTTYKRSERRHCRYWLRRVAWQVNLLLAVLALALVVASTPALAAPRCPGGTATPNGCVYVVRGRLVVWPVQWGARRFAVTVDPEAQP